MAKDKYENLIVRLLIILIILIPLSILVSKKVFKPVKKEKLVLLEYDTEVVDDNFIVERLSNQEKEKKEQEERKKYRWPTDDGYYISTYYSRNHDGIDIAGIEYNSNIYSIYDGEVVTSSYSSTNGNYIVIKDTKGVYSMYAHLGPEKLPKVGDDIKTWDMIGRVWAPFSKDNWDWEEHLHFQIMENVDSPKWYSNVEGVFL